MTPEELQAELVTVQTQLADAQKALADAQKQYETDKGEWAKTEADLKAFNQKMFESASNFIAKYGDPLKEKEPDPAPSVESICAKYTLK